jgi:hypothetical protein
MIFYSSYAPHLNYSRVGWVARCLATQLKQRLAVGLPPMLGYGARMNWLKPFIVPTLLRVGMQAAPLRRCETQGAGAS